MIRNYISVIFFGIAGLMPALSYSQLVSIERDVVASTGNFAIIDNDINFEYTVGETMVTTISDSNNLYFLTQGFNQSGESPLLPPLRFDQEVEMAQCPDIQDGSITIAPDPRGCPGPYTIEIRSNGFVDEVADISGSYTFSNLDSGKYIVSVRGFTLCAERDTIEIGLKNNTCDLKYYSGITPNGDGKNDFWEIDNVEINFPNQVKIFDRWGNIVWEANNYDNRDVSWRGENSSGALLPSGTYYYIIEVDGTRSSDQRSGWIQLIR